MLGGEGDIVRALTKASNVMPSDVNIINMMKAYRETLVVVAVEPRLIASKIAESSRIKVGMVNCKVRGCTKQVK